MYVKIKQRSDLWQSMLAGHNENNTTSVSTDHLEQRTIRYDSKFSYIKNRAK